MPGISKEALAELAEQLENNQVPVGCSISARKSDVEKGEPEGDTVELRNPFGALVKRFDPNGNFIGEDFNPPY